MENEEVLQRIITDKPNSIEVSKNSKGEIQFSIKIYANIEDMEKAIETIKSLKAKIESDFKKETL